MGPLHGIRVLDLSRMLPVGAMSQLLADLGAEIIKVERPFIGEEARFFGATVAGTSATHAFLDRGKKSVALDLKDPRGLAVVHALVPEVDVVLESFRPGTADRLGIGYEALCELNPNLVYCSVNGYGTGGPREQEPGHDLNYLAYAGAAHFGGTQEHGPTLSGVQTADLLGGLAGGIGVLSALLAVRNGGTGSHIEVALADAALWGIGLHLSSWLAGGEAAGPESTSVTGSEPSYRVYKCADDRYLSVAALEPHFWAEFLRALDRSDLLSRQQDPEVVAELAAIIRTESLDHWVQHFAGLEACVAPVQDFHDVAVDKQFKVRQMLVPVPGQDTVLQVGNPIKIQSFHEQPHAASAHVGGHTATVLADLDLPQDVVDAVLSWVTPTNIQGEQDNG